MGLGCSESLSSPIIQRASRSGAPRSICLHSPMVWVQGSAGGGLGGQQGGEIHTPTLEVPKANVC